MPSLGADMEAGTLVEWLVKPGDWIKRSDIVAVVETQKGAIEIETFQAGQIEKIRQQSAGRDTARADSNRRRSQACH
jgi:pyruvate dehydrogenase E2 component (dihydrolipoamide acetyltransferase)